MIAYIRTMTQTPDRHSQNQADDADDTVGRPQLITHGCRLNGYESEAMRALSLAAGLKDVVIVNSCAVTGEAVRQTRQSIRRAHRSHPDRPIVVTGCAAQTDPDRFGAMDEVTAVLGNAEKLDEQHWSRLVSDLHQKQHDTPLMRVNDIMAVRETAPQLIDGYGDRARAFLQIQNGCDHRCTFCIIPYGRGNSRSVPVDRVIEQARRLVANGHKEIVLTGVDITSYGPDLPNNPSLGTLVNKLLDGVPELYRLRLSSIDGAEIDDALFDRITSDPRVAPYLHLSLQSGDDMILKRMKRRHTRRQALDFMARARAQRADMAFGADLIAGFPTETEDMFENSRSLIEEGEIAHVHVFPYSPREGTPAARMPQLPKSTIKARAQILRETAVKTLHCFLDGLIGQTHIAVIESGNRARLGNFATVLLDKTHHIQNSNALSAGQLASISIGGREGDLLTPSAIVPIASI